MEHWLKKYFAGVVLVLIAVAAYFQASGISSLLRAALSGAEAGASSSKLAAATVADRAPACEDLKASLVFAPPNPAFSVVALQGAASPRPILAHVGQDVGGRVVRSIEGNRVVLSAGSSICQVQMSGGARPVFSSSSPSSDPPKDGAPAAGSVPPEIASRIEKVGPNEIHVDRQAMDDILENQTELMRTIRIIPEQANGKMAGMRLFGIQHGSLLDLLGLENGDRLQAINGFELSDPQNAHEAYARLRMADHLTVQINRRGRTLNIDYWIK